MRVTHRAPKLYSGGAWTAQTPTSVVVRDALTNGNMIETLTPHADGHTGWYADTDDANASYIDGTEFWADWHSTIESVDRVATESFWHRALGTGTNPDPPTLTAVNVGDGSTAMLAISGTAGVTYQVLQRVSGVDAWTLGGTRTGSGSIEIDNLSTGLWYEFQAIGVSGLYRSWPSNLAAAYLQMLPASVPSGPLALAFFNLQSLISQSPTFQSWIGATGTAGERIAAAAARLFIEGIDDVPGASYDSVVAAARPYGVILEHRRFAGRKVAELAYLEEGTISVMFEALVPASYASSHSSVSQWFQGTLGAILDDCKELAGTNGNLCILSYELRQIVRAHKRIRKDQGDFAIALFDIVWK